MRGIIAVLLTMLFAWNSSPGGIGALVLCFHPEGGAHVALHEDKTDSLPGCNGLDDFVDSSHCADCVDLVLETTDLGSIRSSEVTNVRVPSLTLANLPDNSLEAIFHPGNELPTVNPTRGPPNVENLSQQISRVVVLRL